MVFLEDKQVDCLRMLLMRLRNMQIISHHLSLVQQMKDKQETETQEAVCRGRDDSSVDLKTHNTLTHGFFCLFLTGSKFYLINK